ncbi:MAG TPA: IS30 family transposase [Nitrospiraceae bacterium]|nr:IS30 family transposase [Nitrospiraceae bacterium]
MPRLCTPVITCPIRPTRAEARRRAAVRRPRLRDPWVRAYVRGQLRQGWSPELIAGRLRRLRPAHAVSHEAIYQWVYAEARDLIPCLVRHHRRRQRRGYSRRHTTPHIPSRVAITERLAAAQTRRQLGHWEADTITTRQGRAALQLAVDRKSQYAILNRLPRRTAAAMRAGLNRSLARFPRPVRRTLTYDNGIENVEHLRGNQVLGTRSYFCTPCTSQERGTVENTAGLVRRFFPKGTNFDTLPSTAVKAVQRWLNHRPRRVLHFQTPAEVFRSGVALRA